MPLLVADQQSFGKFNLVCLIFSLSYKPLKYFGFLPPAYFLQSLYAAYISEVINVRNNCIKGNARSNSNAETQQCSDHHIFRQFSVAGFF